MDLSAKYKNNLKELLENIGKHYQLSQNGEDFSIRKPK